MKKSQNLAGFEPTTSELQGITFTSLVQEDFECLGVIYPFDLNHGHSLNSSESIHFTSRKDSTMNK